MLHMCDVFNSSLTVSMIVLSKQDSVGHGHQYPFHIALQLGDKLYFVHKEFQEKVLTDISLVTDELAIEKIRERLDLQWFPVVHVTWRKAEQRSVG